MPKTSSKGAYTAPRVLAKRCHDLMEGAVRLTLHCSTKSQPPWYCENDYVPDFFYQKACSEVVGYDQDLKC